jgi:hypothetical protein
MNRKFNILKANQLTDLDYHGIAIKDDLAYVVETRRNAIGVYRLPDLEKVKDIKMHEAEHDVLHVNDLHIDGNRLFVSMFSLGDAWRPDKDKPTGGIKEFDLNTLELKTVHFPQALHHPHSVQLREGKLLHCSSFHGQAKHGEEILLRTSGYARGLHLDAKFIGIGNSRTRRDNERIYQAGVYVYKRADKSSRFHDLPATEVYAIMAK